MSDGECKTCRGTSAARVSAAEVDRLLGIYLKSHPDAPLVDDAVYAARLATCQGCPDIQFGGTTCRHCGCLVAVRAKLANKPCPAPEPRWTP